MDSFWLKVVVGIVVIFGLAVIGLRYLPGSLTPKTETTFQDVARQDKQRLLGPPKAKDMENRQEQEQPTEKGTSDEKAESAKENQEEQIFQKPEEPEREKEITLYFREVSQIDAIEAQRQLNTAAPARSIGRLQVGFNLMVKNCRRVMEKWPGTKYDYKARRMLRDDIPERFHRRYDITKEELDLSRFTKRRPHTKPYTIKMDNK